MTTTTPLATTEAVTRARILDLARSWIGTPYHHQASAQGTGTDCVGLVRGVYRRLYGREAEALPGYSRDWAEASGDETLIEAARRHLVEIDPLTAGPADVLVFRYRPRMVAKHTGILGHVSRRAIQSSSSLHCENVSPFPLEGGRAGDGGGPPTAIGQNTRTGNSSVIPAKAGTHAHLDTRFAAEIRSANGSCRRRAPSARPPAPDRGSCRRCALNTCPPNPLLSIGSVSGLWPDTALNLTLIHALEGAPVSEVPFNDWWRRRIAAAFSFPGISD